MAGILGTAYSEGGCPGTQYDARLESALSARTYADLDHVVADLPAAEPAGRSAATTMVTGRRGLTGSR